MPFIPGHEGVGQIAALGPGVANLKEGDLVGVPWLHSACVMCEFCLTGWETLCPQQQNTGYSVNGGFAEYKLAPAAYVGRIPKGLNPIDVAPLILHLIEIPPTMPALQGVVMELKDGGLRLLKGIVATNNLEEASRGVNCALLVGSVPCKPGMERKDLPGVNGKIFVEQGPALQKHAAPNVRNLVVGDPCNTNYLIAMRKAPDNHLLPPSSKRSLF